MERNKVKRIALKITEGLVSTATDLLLLQFFMLGASLGKGKTSRGAYLAIQEANDSLDQYNYRTLKNAFLNLKRKGLIRSLMVPEITSAGKKRLAAILPTYQKERLWDGVVYLITYDVPEEKRFIRDMLRDTLRKIGAGFLQGSVWLTPFNPQQILKEFSQDSGFAGEIIVSCIGKDGYIGDESLTELLERVYQLTDLNSKYKDFIHQFRSSTVDKWQTAVSYLSTLREDPQLPWELLPNDWLGDKAYKLYCKIMSKPKKAS